jgi:hypothetical protein
MQLTADGRYRLWIDGVQVLAGQDASLAGGGTYETGRIGFYDENGTGFASTRAYKEFTAFVPTVKAVCFANRALEISNERQQREASAGVTWGAMPHYRGSDFYLDPAGGVGRVNRVAVKMRRGDLATDLDSSISDKQKTDLWVKPRFLVPR